MRRLLLGTIALFLCAAVLIACGGSSVQVKTTPTTAPGMVFITGSDAPLPSVVAFQVTVNSLTISDGANTATLVSDPTPVEFGRLVGLRTLLGFASVPKGAYTSATVTLSTPVISYLDLSTTPASVGTINGTLTKTTLTVPISPPLTVGEGGLAGLHFHFPLRDSLLIGADGQLTGAVDPKLGIRAIPPEADDAEINHFRGGLVSVNAAGNSFVLQGPRGRLVTVRVDANTEWQGTDTFATLATPAMVEVSGRIRGDGSLLATDVDVITKDHAMVAGVVLDATPNTGAADSITLLVREEMPDLAGFTIGRPGIVTFDTKTFFGIHDMHLPMSYFLFNRAALVRGQDVAIGGVLDTTVDPPVLRTRRAVLHPQGLEGGRVIGSVNIANSPKTGSFKFSADGLFGYVFGAPLLVTTSDRTKFVNLDGLAGLQGTGAIRVRVVGLLLKDQVNNVPVFVAGYVEKVMPK